MSPEAELGRKYPCDGAGQPLAKIVADSNRQVIADDLIASHRFSQKPAVGYYEDHYAKVTTYANILTAYARRLDASVTATSLAPIETTEDDSVFRYTDTATSRGRHRCDREQARATEDRHHRPRRHRLVHPGPGGEAAVAEIHLYDGDRFLWHNVFRSPGAPAFGEVTEPPFKVEYYATRYGQFRRMVIPHAVPVDATNVGELHAMDFVFLALDDGGARKLIAEELEQHGVPFVDVGIGVYEVEGALAGVVRVTTSTTAMREHVRAKNRMPFADSDDRNEYARNIQLAELNALNAALAVLKWKKLFGFYVDLEHEHHSTYTIDGDALTNEDQPDACPEQ